MSDVNEVRLAGRLSFDADPPRTAGSGKVLNLKMETVREHKGREFTDRHAVVLWDALADKIDGARKGDPIEVWGRLGTRSWEKAGAGKVWVTEVIASRVEMGGGQRRDTGGQRSNSTSGSGRQQQTPDDFGPEPRDVEQDRRSGGGGRGGPSEDDIPFLWMPPNRRAFTE